MVTGVLAGWPEHLIGPDECKAALAALGLRTVPELLALACNNDPFFAGSPAHRRDAEWVRRSLAGRRV
jgi:hypothetical protein